LDEKENSLDLDLDEKGKRFKPVVGKHDHKYMSASCVYDAVRLDERVARDLDSSIDTETCSTDNRSCDGV
jgi:hypothetical protein